MDTFAVMHVSGTNLYILLVEDDYQDNTDNFYFEGVRTELDKSIGRLNNLLLTQMLNCALANEKRK